MLVTANNHDYKTEIYNTGAPVLDGLDLVDDALWVLFRGRSFSPTMPSGWFTLGLYFLARLKLTPKLAVPWILPVLPANELDDAQIPGSRRGLDIHGDVWC